MLKNIIFDYGGVIFDIEHNFTALAFTDLGINNIRELFSHENQKGVFLDFETGAVDAARVRDTIRGFGNPDLTDKEIDTAFNAMLIGIPEGNLVLLEQCRQQYRTFLLSNNNAIHYQRITEYLNEEWVIPSIDAYFEQTYYSHLMGIRKPELEAYRFVLDKHQLVPSETLFIDDTPINIAAAAALGMQTRLVGKSEPLAEVLKPYLTTNAE